MSLSSTVLAALIRSKLSDLGFNMSGVGKDGVPWFVNFSEAIAEAIVEHITEEGHATGTDSGGDTHNLNIE